MTDMSLILRESTTVAFSAEQSSFTAFCAFVANEPSGICNTMACLKEGTVIIDTLVLLEYRT
jgi:hypothetical protein